MTDLNAILREIIQNPDDDFPRLCYADCFEEQGQGEYADFIRVQLELAKIVLRRSLLINGTTSDEVHKDNTTKHKALSQREQELLKNELTFLPADSPLLTVGWQANSTWVPSFEWQMWRGFPEIIACTWEDWKTHANEIMTKQPVREVRLSTWPRWIDVIRHPEGRNPEVIEDGESAVLAVIKTIWPKIRFELPPPEYTVAEGTGNIQEWLERVYSSDLEIPSSEWEAHLSED